MIAIREVKNGRYPPHAFVPKATHVRRLDAVMRNPPAPGEWINVIICATCGLHASHPLHRAMQMGAL